MAQLIHTREWRGWTLHECDSLPSTNDFARDLAPWHAIRAKSQTGGRGRHGRRWESGPGGLWVSAVLPLEPPGQGWNAFPLAAGLAVAMILRGLGLREARLRWPNDVLVGRKKICGILMERYAHDRVVVGLGINIANAPGRDAPELQGSATSLAEELPIAPPAEEIYEELLRALRAIHGRVAEEGFASLSDDINHYWGGERAVEVELADETVRGTFLGIDRRGDLLVDAGGRTLTHSAAFVRQLREI